MELVNRISRGIESAVKATVMFFVATFTMLLFIAVVARYVFRENFAFGNEVGRLLFVSGVFLIAGPLWYRKGHLVVDSLLNLLPKPAHRAVTVVYDLLVLPLVALWLWGTIQLLRLDQALTSVTTDLRFTWVFWHSFMLVGWVLLAWFSVVTLINDIQGRQPGGEEK